MTFEKITVPGLSDDENRTANLLLEQLDKKHERNFLRSSLYDGKHAVRQIGTIIPPQYYRVGIVLGWSAKAVDILGRRCNLDGFVWADGDLSGIGGRDVWDDNHLGSEISSAMISSLLHGTAFLINTRGGAGEPEALIHVKDALNATGEWDPRGRRLRNLVSVLGRDDRNQPTEFALYLDGLTISAEKREGKWFVEDRSEHNWGVPAEPLVYKPRVGRPFGSSRISRAVISLHEQALRTVIRMEAHNDVYTIPDLWMFGADESIFKNADGTQKAAWQFVMGRIKGIPDDDEAANPRAEVKQFPASSPEPHVMTLKQQAQLFSGETSIPLTSLGVSDMSNPTSADSYIASREDLIAEAEGATDDWRPALRRSYVRSLAMRNGLSAVPAAWKTIDAKFRSPIYLSRAQQADAGAKQLAAVPWLAETSVGLQLLGLDEQQIRLAQAERQRMAGRALLSRLTEAPANGNNA